MTKRSRHCIVGKSTKIVHAFCTTAMMWGADGSLYYPATTGPWCREKLGWVEPRRITRSGKYTLGDQLSGVVYRIDAGFPEGEYLLIENRQKKYMDSIMPGNGGLLIWHIDDSKFEDWQSAPGWPGQDGWPGNGNHYQLAILSRARDFDMDKGLNYGDEGDLWSTGDTLGPGPARQTVDPSQVSMYPNTDSYSGGVIKNTGIRIYDISDVGEVMSFSVEIPGSAVPPTPSRTSRPTSLPTASPTSRPTSSPTLRPTALPTASPTFRPIPLPTSRPIPLSTASPTSSQASSETSEKREVFKRPFDLN